MGIGPYGSLAEAELEYRILVGDAYILGVDEAIEKFTGKIIAIIHRNDDVEEKWVVAPEGMTFTKEEIREQIHFQEQYFDSEIVM